MTTYEKTELELRRTIDRNLLELADREDVKSQNFKISVAVCLRTVEEPKITRPTRNTDSFPFDPVEPFTNIC